MMIFQLIRRNKGFTLIEIMIVVLVIVALLAVAWPNWMKARESARQRTCVANLRQIETAKEHWAMANKKSTGETVAVEDLVPDFIKTWPSCPSDGTYNPQPIGTDPTCTIENHELP
ncbi:MAG: competence type IV pilus major pilin ComGC [Armatimonadota bacterium]